jgi:hypothetical protein
MREILIGIYGVMVLREKSNAEMAEVEVKGCESGQGAFVQDGKHWIEIQGVRRMYLQSIKGV